MANRGLLAVAAGAVLVAGCSSKPRNFAPMLTAAPTDAQAYEAQWLTCREQVRISTKNGSERGASAIGGVAAGAGGAAAVGAATAGTYATYAGAAAAIGATMLAAPIALVGGAWGISKIKKTKKEKRIKAATAECLAQAGYSVDKWRVMKKREVQALPSVPAPQPAATAAPAASGSSAPPAPLG